MLVPYSSFSIEDIIRIGGVSEKIAYIVHRKINERSYDYSWAVEDTLTIKNEIEKCDPEPECIGTTLGEYLVWENAIEREEIPQKVAACHRKLKTWRRKERRERK